MTAWGEYLQNYNQLIIMIHKILWPFCQAWWSGPARRREAARQWRAASRRLGAFQSWDGHLLACTGFQNPTIPAVPLAVGSDLTDTTSCQCCFIRSLHKVRQDWLLHGAGRWRSQNRKNPSQADCHPTGLWCTKGLLMRVGQIGYTLCSETSVKYKCSLLFI